MNILKIAMKWLLGVLLILAGINHFVSPDFYVHIMPPYLPWPLTLVLVSGVAEVLLGALLLSPRFQSPAAWGLILLLLAVFPANLNMAMHPELFPEFPPATLWFRLPLQGLLIAWAYWFTNPLGRVDAGSRSG